jgi:hypothetical protein
MRHQLKGKHIMNNFVTNSGSDFAGLSAALSHPIASMKMKIAISTLAFLMLSTNLFATDVVILECGEYNFTPGINIRGVGTSLKADPPFLALGSPAAVAITKLLDLGFKIQDSGPSAAPFFQTDNVIHNYTLIRN